jgi:hypothetical protein
MIFTAVCNGLERFCRSESGMALPVALFATAASFALASAAVMATVDSQHGTTRDHNSKEAIAAADAGAGVALMRLNRYAAALNSSTPCLAVSGSTLVLSGAAADGWCPEIKGTVGESSFAYRVSPAATASLTIVATGASGPVSRRVAETLKSSTIGSVLSGAGVIGLEDITLDNNAEIRVGVGTNGNVLLANSASICGNIRHGVGKKTEFTNSASQCSGYGVTEGNQTLPPVSSFMPTDITTNNSDYRLVKCVSTNTPVGCQLDSYETSNHKGFGTTVPWNPATRTISTENNATLTLTGGDYFICKLELANNTHLIMGLNANVRIFFDTPENCNLPAGSEQINVSNTADIQSTAYQVSEGKSGVPGLYLMGSSTIPTKVTMRNNTGTANEFILYAPNTEINIENNATYKGVIAGKSVHLMNSARVEQDAGFEPPLIGGAKIFSRQSYVECVGATGSPPSANC